jgi:tRNA(fMet)-specific endonuclease VapC
MTNYLLDSNHVSPLVTLDHPLRKRVLNASQGNDMFALTSVNLAEFLFGIGTLPRAEQNQREWDRLRPTFRVYQVEEMDALESAQIRVFLRRHGRQLGIVDALLAAIALRYDLTLLTTDGDFDAVPDLKCENWLPRASA